MSNIDTIKSEAREFVEVAIRPDQIEYLNEALSFDKKNNKPPALVRVIIKAELVDKSFIDSTYSKAIDEAIAVVGEDIEGNADIFSEEQEQQIIGQNWEKSRIRTALDKLKK